MVMGYGKSIMVEVFKGDTPERIPIAPLIGVHSANICGIKPSAAFHNSEVMADLQYRAVKYYKSDIVTTWMDLTFEPEALGAKVKWNVIPQIAEHVTLSSLNEIDSLPEDITSMGRFPVYVNALSILKEKAQGEYLVCSYLSGPLTLPTSLLGVRKILKAFILEKDFIRKLLEKITTIQLNSAKALIKAGAECIIILEPTASLISKKIFEEYILDKLKTLTDFIHQNKSYIILHMCGKSGHLLDTIDNIGVDALSIDDNVDIELAFKRVRKSSIMGNISTISLLNLDPREIKKLAEDLLGKVDKHRFILSTGCDIPYNTPQENLKTFIETCLLLSSS